MRLGRHFGWVIRERPSPSKIDLLERNAKEEDVDQVRVEIGSGQRPRLSSRPSMGVRVASQWCHSIVRFAFGLAATTAGDRKDGHG
jgi:hypothetical protein